MLWPVVYTQSHARSACASAHTREERQLPTNSARVLFARVLARGARDPEGEKSFAKTKPRAPKKVSASAHARIRARPSLHTYLRQATTPTSRRWKGVHAALEFGVLREENWMGVRGAHARSAKRAYSAG